MILFPECPELLSRSCSNVQSYRAMIFCKRLSRVLSQHLAPGARDKPKFVALQVAWSKLRAGRALRFLGGGWRWLGLVVVGWALIGVGWRFGRWTRLRSGSVISPNWGWRFGGCALISSRPRIAVQRVCAYARVDRPWPTAAMQNGWYRPRIA